MTLKNRFLAGATAVAAIAAAGPALADHAWSNYHWSTPDGVVTILVVDNTTGDWRPRVQLAVSDWNKSAHIDSAYDPNGTNNNRRCSMIQDTIQVCNSAYGNTGWLGIASISLSGGHIVAGTTKLNDTYFAYPQYNNEADKQLVTCQEIGHDYGLGHQNEDFNTDATDSCMEYTSDSTNNTQPDFHDYAMLDLIYGHNEGGTTGGGGGDPAPCKGRGCKGKSLGFGVGNTQAEWGRAVGYDAQNRPNVFKTNINGYEVVTHVTWAPDARRNTDPGNPHDHDDHTH